MGLFETKADKFKLGKSHNVLVFGSPEYPGLKVNIPLFGGISVKNVKTTILCNNEIGQGPWAEVAPAGFLIAITNDCLSVGEITNGNGGSCV